MTEDILRQACNMKARAHEATDAPGALAALVGENGSTPGDAAAPDGVAESPIIEASPLLHPFTVCGRII